ncbi:MAG: hypothetical protein ACQESC_00985 [Nanobdellota archaeon]
MKQKEIKSFLEKGYVRATVIFELVGKPKEHVTQSIKAYLENIKTDSQIEVIDEDYEDTEEMEEGMFSTVVEADMLIASLEKFTWLCINFTPASIEMIEPESVTITQKEWGNWMNDLLSNLHEIGMTTKTLRNQNTGLVKNFNAMTRNAILLALQKPLDAKTISKRIGLDEKNTTKYLEALKKENKITQKQQHYYLKN